MIFSSGATDMVFRHRPHSIEEIKQKITEGVQSKYVENHNMRASKSVYKKKIQQCIDVDGHLGVGDIIFFFNFKKWD